MSDSWRIKKHSFIRLVLDFIKKLFGFFVFQRIKNKKDYNWKIRKNAALFEDKKKKKKEWIVGAMLELHCHQALLIKEDPPRWF